MNGRIFVPHGLYIAAQVLSRAVLYVRELRRVQGRVYFEGIEVQPLLGVELNVKRYIGCLS